MPTTTTAPNTHSCMRFVIRQPCRTPTARAVLARGFAYPHGHVMVANRLRSPAGGRPRCRSPLAADPGCGRRSRHDCRHGLAAALVVDLRPGVAVAFGVDDARARPG